MDWSDDDFVEIPRFRARREVQLAMRCVRLGRAKTERVQFTLRPALLAEISGHRYRIDFAPRKRLFRIRADDRGQYEAFRAGRGELQILRCELPAGMVCSEAVEEPEFYVDAIGRAIVIEAPAAFFAPPARALPAPAPALPAPVAEAERDPVLAATLGLTALFPRQFGDIRLTPAEASVLEVLYRNARASKTALMMATADDASEDERGDKLADVYVSKLRTKLKPLGIEIETLHGDGFRMPAGAKAFLKRFVEAS